MWQKNLLLNCYKFDCRSCGNNKLKRVVSLGYQPLANNLLNKKDEKCELYPLEVNYCDQCHNCQHPRPGNPGHDQYGQRHVVDHIEGKYPT